MHDQLKCFDVGPTWPCTLEGRGCEQQLRLWASGLQGGRWGRERRGGRGRRREWRKKTLLLKFSIASCFFHGALILTILTIYYHS